MDAKVVKNSLFISHEGFGIVQGAMRILSLVVFLGTLLMWVMMPTDTYKQSWLPSIREKTNSTYFGTQGLD